MAPGETSWSTRAPPRASCRPRSPGGSRCDSTDLAQRQSTVCSVITVPLVHSGPWSVPGLALHPQLIGSTDFGSISLSGTVGLLGSDQLRRFGWVVLDYTGGQMVLG